MKKLNISFNTLNDYHKYFLGVLFLLSFFHGIEASSAPTIGIVGAGIGGSSCAYFLRSLFGNDTVIDIFEANKVGGRLSTTEIDGKIFEEGGSIIHPRNKYMTDFLELLHLKKRQPSGGYFGLYDGKDFVFSESDWKIVTAISAFYRYGIGLFKLNKYIDSIIDSFSRIYELQENSVVYNNVSSLLKAMNNDFIDKLSTTTKIGFEKAGISQIVVDEIVMAALRVNYGQDTSVHQFVGMVSVAGAGSDLWAVEGGNYQIPQGLIEKSKARVIPEVVTSISRQLSNKIKINENDYDIVVIATPQTDDMKMKIKFDGFNETFLFPGSYHQTVCTIVKGDLRDNFFKNKSPIIDEILTISDDIFVNSVSRIYPVNSSTENKSKSRIWKIFSQKELVDSEISSLFTEVEEIYVKNWLAYPHYDTNQRLDSFILSNNLYHVNAIEWAASAMEMSAIGGRNVALLAFENWFQTTGNLDIPRTIPDLKTGDHGNFKKEKEDL